jgi:beta-lactamase class A
MNEQKMKAGSIIKLYIMIEAYNQIKKGTLDKNKIIILNNSMKVGGSGSLSNELEGTKVSVFDLIRLMITKSDNTAANILIDILSFDKINSTAKNIGCKYTVLSRKMMDTKAISQGKENYTSVSDLLNIYWKIYKSECIGSPYDKEMIEILKNQTINTKIPLTLPKGTSIAHKTGELQDVESDAGIVYSPRGDYVLCIMTSNVTSVPTTRNIIGSISKFLWNYNLTQ